jgi:hypothetical protein
LSLSSSLSFFYPETKICLHAVNTCWCGWWSLLFKCRNYDCALTLTHNWAPGLVYFVVNSPRKFLCSLKRFEVLLPFLVITTTEQSNYNAVSYGFTVLPWADNSPKWFKRSSWKVLESVCVPWTDQLKPWTQRFFTVRIPRKWLLMMWHHRVDFPFSSLSMNMKPVITLHVVEWSNSSMSQNTPVKTHDCMLFVFRCIHAQCTNPSSFLVSLDILWT